MAAYLAQEIEEGKLDYKTVFSNPKLFPLKSQVDIILTNDGFSNLIVPLG